MINHKIAKIFYEIAVYLEMDDVPFKPQAYKKVASSLEGLSQDVGDIYKKGGREALEKIPGVGAHIAEKMEEFIKTGTFGYYTKLKKKMPVDVLGMARVEGVGPKVIKELYKRLAIKNIDDLERAARAGKIRKLPHYGEKSEKKILRGIEFLKREGNRFILGFVEPFIRDIEKRFQKAGSVKRLEIAGSFRRRKETIGDIDILAVADKPLEAMNFFTRMPEVVHIYGYGPTKANVRLENGMDADLRIVPERSWGAALNYFTGSKEHNIALRRIAQEKGWKLSEYGLFKGKRYIGGRTEEELYKKLGLQYIEPEMREDAGEIEASRNNTLPRLIGYQDLRGDLQIQTDWTDGEDSIETIAQAAFESGLEYIAITDHTKSLAMAGGSDEKKLERQMKEIDTVNAKFRSRGICFAVLKGAEVNIRKDGTLDINNETLKLLDVVGIAVHSHFTMSKKEMTARIIRAMQNPYAHILFHPTGRIINRREAYDIDIDAIINTAKETRTILEIDAFPDRLDLKDEYVRKAVSSGVKLAIDSDAHAVRHIAYLAYGTAQARRGWATKRDIINALPIEKMKQSLKKQPS